ncbi:MAG TPA: helix-turn-helix domain-containing protein [Vicinamibacterales bacterium]|nr:helix-turn-helix domain-containing protein [Vicinamibacterales bacterium]
MLKTTSRISLADLSAAGIVMTAQETVAIVREVIQQVARGEHLGVPSAHVIRLSASGAVSIEGPVEAGGRPIPRIAQLLESLLPRLDAPPPLKAPGALRLVIARALGTLDLPPFPSLDSFADALARFAAPDPAQAVQDLFIRWAAIPDVPAGTDGSATRTASGPDQDALTTMADFKRSDRERHDESAGALVRLDPASLTVSDIRRARRATGLSLYDVSERSRIPVPLLRQLEWGYLYRWPGGLYGRTQLIRYARAAGLDDVLVVSTLSPLLDEMGEVAPPASGNLWKLAPGEACPQPEPVVRREPVVRPEITIIELEPGEAEFADEAEAVTLEPASPRQDDDRCAELPPFRDGELIADEPQLFREIIPAEPRRRSRVVPALAAAATIAIAAVGGYWSQIERDDSSSPPPVAARAAEPNTPATSDGSNRSPAVSAPAPPAAQDRVDSSVRPGAPDKGAVPEGTTAAAARGHDQRPEALMDGEILSPSFASVGSAMFYRADESAQAGVVRVGSAGAGEVLRITRVVDDDNARNFHARPSPDGTQVAFDSDRDGERAVYVADADGHNVRRVSGDGFAAIPSWSPDGRSLAFVRAEVDRRRVWNLWAVDLQSGSARRLTSNAEGQPSGASWFPDGKRIAYSRGDRVVVLDVANGRERTYASPRAGKAVRSPAVSPDGRRVMFQVQHDGAWLLDLTDGSMLKVLSDPSADNYSWSPDGHRVAYQSQRSGEWGVWVMGGR